jgi:hypothetical protein
VAAKLPNTAKMQQWLRPGGMYGADAFPGILSASGKPLAGGKATGSTTSKSGTKRKRTKTKTKLSSGSSSGGTSVSGYTTRNGRRVRAYKRGTTQSQSQVRQQGLVWGGRVYHSRSQFARSLARHGTSINVFARRHRNAYRGLTTSFTKTSRSR